MRFAGKITSWKDDRGFGFITPTGSEKRVFVHISSFVYNNRRPVEAEMVSYEIVTDASGREKAQNVLLGGERRPPESTPASEHADPFLLFACGYFLFACGAVFFFKSSVIILGLYIIASIVSFFTYASDKSAAKKGRWRISEGTLHFLALIGGWPGALISQRLLHHKTKKQSFQIIFWITVVLNCFLFLSIVTGASRFFVD